MAIDRSSAIVIGSFPLGESDRVVTFFTRRAGKVRGVARSARRIRSRFGSALELFTLGELVFFDSERTDLVQIDHFDIVCPFAGVRDDLERLGHAAWIAECVTRLSADRDPSPGLFGLLRNSLDRIERGAPPGRVAVVFGIRCIATLGHRLRTDACVVCGRARNGGATTVAVDVESGGTVCPVCARALRTVDVSAAALASLRRLGGGMFDEAVDSRLARSVEDELRTMLEMQITGLIGQSTRSARFLREVTRVPTASEARG